MWISVSFPLLYVSVVFLFPTFSVPLLYCLVVSSSFCMVSLMFCVPVFFCRCVNLSCVFLVIVICFVISFFHLCNVVSHKIRRNDGNRFFTLTLNWILSLVYFEVVVSNASL